MKKRVIRKKRLQSDLIIAVDNKFIVGLNEIDYFDLLSKEDFKTPSEYQEYLLKFNTSEDIDKAYVFKKDNNYLPKYTPENNRFWGESGLKPPETIFEVRDFYKSIYSNHSVEILSLDTKIIIEKTMYPYNTEV